MSASPRYYESMILTKSSLTEQKNREIIEKLTNFLREDETQIVGEEYLGVRSLSYQIGHATKAYYTLLVLHTVPNNIQILSKSMKNHAGVLRYLHMRVDAPPHFPTPIMLDMKRKNADISLKDNTSTRTESPEKERTESPEKGKER